MKKLVCILLLLFPLFLCGQPPITFQKWYDFGFAENSYAIQQTFDGGYIMAGRQGINFSVSNLLLIKTDSAGNQQWVKFINTGVYEHEGHDIKQLPDSGYIITGMMSATGGANFYLVRTDKNGDTLWTKSYDKSTYDWAYSVQPTFDNGYIIVGTSDTLGWLLKTDNNGDTLWTKKYISVGSIASNLRCVEQMPDSGFTMCGSISSTSSTGKIFLIRVDKNGDTLWTKQYNRMGSTTDIGYSFHSTSDGGYIIAGITPDTSSPYWNCYLIRTNSFGDTLWTKSIGGMGDDAAWSVKENLNGDFVVGGYFFDTIVWQYDAYLFKVNSNGNLIWQKKLGTLQSDYGYDMILTQDGGIAITGTCDTLSGIFLYKTDSAGNIPTFIEQPPIPSYNFNVYPNPFSTTTIVDLSDTEFNDAELKLYDGMGRFVKSFSLNNSPNKKIELNREGLADGVYILQLVSDQKTTHISKIIIVPQ